jgi:hypothetical protein
MSIKDALNAAINQHAEKAIAEKEMLNSLLTETGAGEVLEQLVDILNHPAGDDQRLIRQRFEALAKQTIPRYSMLGQIRQYRLHEVKNPIGKMSNVLRITAHCGPGDWVDVLQVVVFNRSGVGNSLKIVAGDFSKYPNQELSVPIEEVKNPEHTTDLILSAVMGIPRNNPAEKKAQPPEKEAQPRRRRW